MYNGIKNKFVTFMYILTVALMVACTQDDNQMSSPPVLEDGTRTSLGIVSTFLNCDAISTRASYLIDGTHSIGFFVKANVPNGYAPVSNREGIYSGAPRNLWLPADSIWLNEHFADLAVYAPYDVTQPTTGVLNLVAGLRTDASKDIGYKHFTANNRTQKDNPASLSLVLNHIYTRLTFVFYRDVSYSSTATISNLKLTGADIYTKAVFNPFDENEVSRYTCSAPGVDVPLSVPLTVGENKETGAIFDLLLIPSTLTEGITATVIVDGRKMQIMIPQGSFANRLEAGKQYRVAVKLMAAGLNITSVIVFAWEDIEVGNGDAEFE